MMRKKGSAIIYILILMIPVMFLSMSILETSNINFKIASNVISSRQALYNSEAGVIYGIRKLEAQGYNENYSQYNSQRYIIFDNKSSASESQNYSETTISYFNNKFTITSRGHCGRFSKTKVVVIDKSSL